jgi:hypothetical protein
MRERVIESHGVRVAVCASVSLWQRIEERLPPGAIEVAGPAEHTFSITAEDEDVFALYEDEACILRTGDLEHIVDSVESAVRLCVATFSTDWLFVHAGVVGWRGRAIVMPAPSWSGKSELVVNLLHAGATYYSDEYAVIDDDGLVHPYARPAALRNGGDRRTKRRIPTRDLGFPIGNQPIPICLVVSTRFVQGASWAPRAMSRAEAVLALISNTVRARIDPPTALGRLTRAVRHASAIEGPRNHAHEAAAAILEFCELEHQSV